MTSLEVLSLQKKATLIFLLFLTLPHCLSYIYSSNNWSCLENSNWGNDRYICSDSEQLAEIKNTHTASLQMQKKTPTNNYSKYKIWNGSEPTLKYEIISELNFDVILNLPFN